MKILLSYSKKHFDPRRIFPNEYDNSSAAILARALYQTLKRYGNVTYVAHSEASLVNGKSFDLFVGIANHFNDFNRVCHLKRKILFAVNMHPHERNRIITQFMKREKIPSNALTRLDLVDEEEIEKSLRIADRIICVGNETTRQSYLKNGLIPNKITMINYGLNTKLNKKLTGRDSIKTKRFVYVASELGIRKGFDIVNICFSNLYRTADFHLDIIGGIYNNYYQRQLETFSDRLKRKLTYYGWVSSKEKKYWQILDGEDFLVYPSLEEGQAGTVIDALSSGIIPILSCNTGVSYSPFGWMELKLHSQKNRNLLELAMRASNKTINDLRQKTYCYYEKFHANYIDAIHQVITRDIGMLKL